MKLVLPPNVSRRRFDQALAAFARVVGSEWVLATDEDRETYLDIYAPGNEVDHAPAAAVAPADVEQVQAVLRLANEYRIPLWPVSRGKNFGYGGAAPRMPGTVILDTGRLNRIIEVNPELGYCIVEPGVGFFDLYDHLKHNGLSLQLGLPGNAWGSVLGNALERGMSRLGFHSENICGLEVVLPDGSLLRTGMGAMQNNPTWSLFKHGFGPAWDQMFVQSNFGVVTKMGMWLQPEPEVTINIGVKLHEPEDLGWWTDIVTALHLRGVLSGNVSVTSFMASATVRTQRSQWYDKPGTLPDSVIADIMRTYDVGWWNGTLTVSGYPEVAEAQLRVVRKAFAEHDALAPTETRSVRGEAGPRNAPSVAALQIVNWHGGRGGHIGFSPILPANGRLVVEQLRRTRALYARYGIDFSSTFYNGGRAISNVNLMLYNRDDAELTGRTRALFAALVQESAAHGYAEYRTHLSYMDEVAGSFDFNNHALARLNAATKDHLDPNGVLAPGKSGIWPKVYRERQGKA